MGLLKELGSGPVGIDTAPFIYLIEEHPRYRRVVRSLFEAIDRGRIQAVTSELTLLETLVIPYRTGDQDLARRYEAILTNSRNLEMIALTRPLLRSASALRAATSIRTPDALQLAAAMSRRCSAFVTNDRSLPEIGGMRVLQFDDFVQDR